MVSSLTPLDTFLRPMYEASTLGIIAKKQIFNDSNTSSGIGDPRSVAVATRKRTNVRYATLARRCVRRSGGCASRYLGPAVTRDDDRDRTCPKVGSTSTSTDSSTQDVGRSGSTVAVALAWARAVAEPVRRVRVAERRLS